MFTGFDYINVWNFLVLVNSLWRTQWFLKPYLHNVYLNKDLHNLFCKKIPLKPNHDFLILNFFLISEIVKYCRKLLSYNFDINQTTLYSCGYIQNLEMLQIHIFWDKLHALHTGTCYIFYLCTNFFHFFLWVEATLSFLNPSYLITGVPWGPIWSGSGGERGRGGHQQTVWGPLHEELWLVQNTGSGHQSRLAHGLHYSAQRGEN